MLLYKKTCRLLGIHLVLKLCHKTIYIVSCPKQELVSENHVKEIIVLVNNIVQKPLGFEKDLSEYKAVLFDGWCGEPVAWGFQITTYLGDERFDELSRHLHLECVTTGTWVAVVKSLTREEAILQYGEITEEIKGPRGGWKSTTFGNKKFASKFLKP